ncbi:hypothetical protein C5167_029708 [Papaver somniferum]|nr:hypothetical protein C5167_029708 [Papaver somniferum]
MLQYLNKPSSRILSFPRMDDRLPAPLY